MVPGRGGRCTRWQILGCCQLATQICIKNSTVRLSPFGIGLRRTATNVTDVKKAPNQEDSHASPGQATDSAVLRGKLSLIKKVTVEDETVTILARVTLLYYVTPRIWRVENFMSTHR
jgi:hypothetical protein